MSIIFFMDNKQLCTEIRKVCRKLFKKETNDSVKKRHSEFANILRLLWESINLFGKETTKYQSFIMVLQNVYYLINLIKLNLMNQYQ